MIHFINKKVELFTGLKVNDSIIFTLKSFSYFIAGIISSIFSKLDIDTRLLTWLAIFMAIDTLTGLTKQYRIKKDLIKSKPLKDGIFKKLVVLSIPLIIACLCLVLKIKPDKLLGTYFTAMILAEAYSSIANLVCAYNKEPKEEYDAVSAVLKWTKDKIYSMLRAIIINDSKEKTESDEKEQV